MQTKQTMTTEQVQAEIQRMLKGIKAPSFEVEARRERRGERRVSR